ncbi:response regulator transcription factor [Paenibacillus eucommiae]|uniref:Two-component system response regulator YesN n=1 Tax=Paenibacillus eucommiae TaxID=1355755 RepID=A0ABS4IMU1_9BACL|nr:response regulator [Paenibacillus eucommiae]MBP1988820.1 two-component system response regulator YesN [Paenibacillus eucommiae]
MYKVMLVDDEKWIIKSLKTSIDWHAHGFEIIAEASNGFEGLEKIKQLSPDLVFTDIRMPGMDGLELIRQTNELNKGISFIITSGYKEFEYAKKAIQYGALDYCLKPFEEEEIIDILNKFSSDQQAKHTMVQTELLNLLQDNEEASPLHVKDCLRRLGMTWSEEKGATVIVVAGSGEFEFELPASVERPYITLRTGRNKKVYVIQGEAAAALRGASFSEGLSDNIQGIGIAAWIQDTTAIMNAITEANTAAHHFFIAGEKGVWTAFSPKGRMEEMTELLRKLSRTQDAACIQEIFEKIDSFIADGDFTIHRALHVYNMVLFSVYHLAEEQFYSYEQLLNKFNTLEEMKAYLQKLIIEPKSEQLPESNKNPKNITFLNILSYMDEHFREDISLQSISEKLQINLSYVSQLFRKNGSETFLQYLTKKRIACACELLRNSSLSIQEVSEQVGYADYFHFAKTFKKSMGQTATQYRESAGKPPGSPNSAPMTKK